MPLACLLPLLAGVLTAAPELPRTARVVADWVDVLEEPDDAAFATDQLDRGRRVVIRREGPAGWLAIDPPPGAFSWIDRDAVEDLGGGRGRVVARAAAVRPGRAGARLPGSLGATLRRGAAVRLLDRPPLVVRQPGGARAWLAIAPPAGEVRYLRAEGVDDNAQADPEPPPPRAGAPARIARPAGRRVVVPVDRSLATLGPTVPESRLPGDVAAELARVGEQHRAALRAPLDRWALEPVRRAYRALLDREADPGARAAIQARLGQVARQEAAARAARDAAAALERSRRLDAEVDAARSRLAGLDGPGAVPYEAEGLLHPSSRLVEGRKVYLLVGDDGEPAAYLSVPPGLDAARLVSRRVGVRGTTRFQEDLRARLITVRDLEPLDEAP